MEYGMAFVVDMYDFERGEELHVITMPGDYIRTSRWAGEHLAASGDEVAANLLQNYATVWHALKRQGKLAEMGLPEELDSGALDAMADRFSIFVKEMDEASLPLTGERVR